MNQIEYSEYIKSLSKESIRYKLLSGLDYLDLKQVILSYDMVRLPTSETGKKSQQAGREAAPTDATPVTRDVTVYKELNDSDKDRNLAGAVIKVFKDSACTESITEFVLSYDGKSYGGDDRVVYKNLEERANANASKAIAKLQEDTYYYQLDKKLFRSNDDYSKTGYDYNNTVGSFSIVAGAGVQEIKLDNNAKTQILSSPLQRATLRIRRKQGVKIESSLTNKNLTEAF